MRFQFKNNFMAKIFGNNDREIGKLQGLVDQINAKEAILEKLSDQELKDQTRIFKEQISRQLADFDSNNRAPVEDSDGEASDTELAAIDEEFRNQRLKFEQKILDDLLPSAFAVVREAARRTLKQRHYDVQLIGGIVLHQGKIAEMKTGEGKTLVATLPLYLNALLGKGVHLVTVNDFLGKYHAQWMGQIYDALGMTTGAIEHDRSWIYSPEAKNIDALTEEELDSGLIDPDWPHLTAVSRREAYAADITYGTNNEFGFDYLRDNMVQNPLQMVQRGHRFAIVDEVDSILIDEARTPLIISAPAEESASTYGQFAVIARGLIKTEHYKVNEKDRAVSITDAGIAEVERLTGITNFYAADNILNVHHLEAALKAEALFSRDKDYVVKEGEIIIIDEFTGRLMEGRRYSEGLHQAIEAKEGVEVKRESDTLATVSFQNLFRLYDKLAGMTGTAETEAEEFYKIYKLEVVTIPTNRPMIRVDQHDLIYKNETAKFNAVIKDVKQRTATGQPVLIGTISVAKNELLSSLLTQAGVNHQVLNAKKHEQEAQIIAQAGRLGAVTLATNMAGRGVDIILGGTPVKPDEAARVRELGGLHVIGTERHESRRIDNQLRGRSGRQGDPGSSIFYVSMEDDLMRIFGGERMKAIMEKLGVPDDEAIQHSMISGSIESAQKRVEGHNFDIRKHLVEYDDVMNKHRTVIYRRRRHIMESDPANEDWLHEDILAMLSADEQPLFQAKVEQFTLESIKQLERAVYLQVIDRYWIDHLNAMQELREGIGLRGYGQHDPLVEYKHEAYNLFQRLLESIDDEVVEILLKVEIVQPPVMSEVTRPLNFQGADESLAGGAISNSALEPESLAQPSSSSTVSISSAPNQFSKVGRNEACPCGSGKKFKKCHGK